MESIKVKKCLTLIASSLALLSGLFASSVSLAAPIFSPLDLSGVTNGSPNFVNQTFTQGGFSTQFDGTLVSSTGTVGTTVGNAVGDLALGTSSGGSINYSLDFDDPILLQFGHEKSIGFVTGPFDVWTLSATGVTFTVQDPGVADITVISNSPGSITFSGLTGGDKNWMITTSVISSQSILFNNTAGGGNVGPFNIQAASVSEPSLLAIMFVGLIAIAGLRQRK